MNKTTYRQFIQAASQGKRVALYQLLDVSLLITPSQAFQCLQTQLREATLLECKPRTTTSYSFIGFDPIATFTAHGSTVSIDIDAKQQTYHTDPFLELRKFRNRIACIDTHPLLSLMGGAIGYFGYDAVRLIEKLPSRHENLDNLPDIQLNFYGSGIIFDHNSGKIMIGKIVDVEKNLKNCYNSGMQAIEKIIQALSNYLTHPSFQAPIHDFPIDEDRFSPDMDDNQYAKIVSKAKVYIAKGDIFQVVPSRVFKKTFYGNPFSIYQALKQISPSPYHFYMKQNDMILVGASPEKIVSLKNNVIESIPLAGTKPRHAQHSDHVIADALLNDPKELAEHMMLLDLARNDVGAVAKPGSVKVTAPPSAAIFSHVIHI